MAGLSGFLGVRSHTTPTSGGYELALQYPRIARPGPDGTWWPLSFNRPPGETLVVCTDVYIRPGCQHGRSGTLRVLDHGRTAASVDSTTLLP